MKISKKILSIPPYISTNWANVSALYMREGFLVVSLLDGDVVEVPGLSLEQIQTVFDLHTKYAEEEERLYSRHAADGVAPPFPIPFPPGIGGGGFQIAFGGPEGFSNIMEHNPEQMNAPDLPPEVIEKVSTISKMLSQDTGKDFPEAEPHCNCMHCQIARALNGEEKNSPLDEEVPAEELQFQQWEIEQTDDQMYTVTNKLEPSEKFNVFLGNPVGCTCGKEGCEHILAVLRA